MNQFKQKITGILFVFIVIGSSPLSAQHLYWKKSSPYELSWKKDLLITGVTAGIFVGGVSAERNEEVPEFSMGSFTQADIDKINFLDRGVAGRWDVQAKDAGKIFKFSAKFLAPTALALLPGSLEDRGKLGLMYLQGFFLNAGLVSLAKGKTNRYRPFSYLSLEQIGNLRGEAREEFLEDVVDDDIEDSFYSGDAAATSFGLIFFAKIFNDYYPDSKWRKVVWAGSIAGTGLGAFFRAKSGKHFPTDVLVGSTVGAGLGLLIPHLHKRKQKSPLSIHPGLQSLSIVYKFK